MNNSDYLTELIGCGLSSLFDSNPINFSSRHKKEGKRAVSILKKPPRKIYKFKKSILRNSFLSGCLEYTKGKRIEHLIVGLGRKRARGTDISKILHIKGNENSVVIPEKLHSVITMNALMDPKSEVAIFHNHPPNWINAVFNNNPLASSADRNVMITQKFLEMFFFFRGIFGQGWILFYLGENGKVREIRGPNLMNLLSYRREF